MLPNADPAALLKRLRADVEANIELSDSLKALGMGIAFNSKQAGFSGMACLSAGELVISSVKHKTYIDVAEKGTEAAADTAVGVTTKYNRILSDARVKALLPMSEHGIGLGLIKVHNKHIEKLTDPIPAE